MWRGEVWPDPRTAHALRLTWRRQAVGDTGALAASKYAAAGLGLLTTLVAARWLGPSEYGVAVLAIAHCELLFALTSFKSVTVATHYISALRAEDKPGQAAAVVKLSLLLDVGMGILTALIAFGSVSRLVPWIYQSATIGPLIAAFALSLPFTGLVGTSTAALTAVGRFRWLAIVTVLDRFIMLALVVTALLLGGGVREYVVARMATQIIMGLVLLATASRALSQAGIGGWWRARLGRIGHLSGELRSFFGWSYLSGTCVGLMAQVPLLLLGRLAGSTSAGFFGVARNILNVTLYVETTLGQIVYPKLSAASTGTIAEVLGRARRWTLWGGLPTGVAVAAATALLPLALPVVLGERYVPVVDGSRILMLGAIVSASVFWVQPLYYSRGRIGDWTKSLAVDVVLVIALAVFIVPSYGWLGLCWLLAVNRGVFRLLMAFRITRLGSRPPRAHRSPDSP
jgi:O-antigen/teichoic acid export membrane protein